jgi:hypothetical protein
VPAIRRRTDLNGRDDGAAFVLPDVVAYLACVEKRIVYDCDLIAFKLVLPVFEYPGGAAGKEQHTQRRQYEDSLHILQI